MNANELKVLEDALKVIEQLQAEIQALKITIAKITINSSLTDDEIIQTYADIDGRGIVKFARAILRKAQEQ